MPNNKIYILDVGSSKIALLTCIKSKNHFSIFNREEVAYDGYMDGEFLNESALFSIFTKLFSDHTQNTKTTIKKLYVGVPSEFCICVCKRVSNKFIDYKRIHNHDIMDLFDGIDSFEKSKEYEILNFSPMQFTLDDGYKTIDPLHKKTKTITMDCSYVLAKKYFLSLYRQILGKIGISSIEFVSTALGQALNCVDQNNPLDPVAIVDVGHISTSVSIIKGEGLELLSSFSLGGGHISSDIMQVLKISYFDADLLKKKVVLTVEPEKGEKYEILANDRQISASISICNEIVKSRIENIGNIIKNILDINDKFKNIKVYLTGDGLSKIKGARQILSAVIDREIIDYYNKLDYTKHKYQTSSTGLVNLCAKIQ